ncbi:MAG TPA: hypothetical protein VFV38_26550 [Ktedonobacteraceae bacterium]|nr:hypothetical protein [Ktedonobacteraceae bacterium]
MTTSALEIATVTGVHRYAIAHWQLLQPYLEGTEQDPKKLFHLADDTWNLWPYARSGTPSYALEYRVNFAGLRSFLKPFLKWYCYQQVLQSPGDVRTTLAKLPSVFKRVDEYFLSQGYTSLDDLAPPGVFEHFWRALLPQKDPPFAPRDVQLQAGTHSFWRQISAMFGIPVSVPPLAPVQRKISAEIGLNEQAIIPQPVIAQLTNILGLHREGKRLLNRFHHLRLCILLLNLCLGRRITEVLLAERGNGPDGPLTTFPARGHGEKGGLWFRFAPNKGGQKTQVYISPAWHDMTRYCVKIILFYSDEVRHLAVPEEQALFILISEWNLTSGAHGLASPATEQDTDYEYCQLNASKSRRRPQKTTSRAKAMTYHVFLHWLSGHSRGTQGPRTSSIFEQWGITVDGKAESPMYFMYTQQARHTRQSVLAEDPNIAPLTRQRDLNHTSRDMQMVYQHHLRKANAKLRERVASHQLHGLGMHWLEQCLGLVEPGTQNAFREGTPHSFDARWQALLVNNPQFVQANRVPCGLCAFPQGPEGCPEFMHCTEATDEGCAWFLTDPDDIQMQRELLHRAREHRIKQQESQTLGRTVQAHKYGVMAKRTEHLRDEALQKTSEEIRRALLAELHEQEEMR